jgi:hypothetical protein
LVISTGKLENWLCKPGPAEAGETADRYGIGVLIPETPTPKVKSSIERLQEPRLFFATSAFTRLGSALFS